MSEVQKLEMDDIVKMEVDYAASGENALNGEGSPTIQQQVQETYLDVKCEKHESATFETFQS